MRPDVWLWLLLPALAVAAMLGVFWACDLVIRSFTSRPEDDDRAEARRRGVSGAAFALQEAFDPGVAHVVRAGQDVRVEEANPIGGDGDETTSPDAFLEGIVAALTRSPIDPEEVRRLLTDADRAGNDWRGLYDKGTGIVRAEHPYLAPALPPAGKVAPR